MWTVITPQDRLLSLCLKALHMDLKIFLKDTRGYGTNCKSDSRISDEAKDGQTTHFSDPPWQKSLWVVTSAMWHQAFQPTVFPGLVPSGRKSQWRKHTVHVHWCLEATLGAAPAGSLSEATWPWNHLHFLCKGAWNSFLSLPTNTSMLLAGQSNSFPGLPLVGIYAATITNHLCIGIYRAPITGSCT